MAFKVIILKRADLELDEAVIYYEEKQKGLGKKFLLSYGLSLKTLYKIQYFSIKYREIRTLPIKKYPYTIHFRVDEIEKIVSILAVTSDYQNPNTTRIKP